MEDIDHYNIPIYNFPFDVEEDDEETVLLPFAIIGSEEEIIVNGRAVRGRQYPWGIVEAIHINFVYLFHRDTAISSKDLATQSVRIKEEQLKREEEKLREIELKVQREISEKRQELLAKEEALRNLEA
ncbi:12783_t:CDS:2, partial [Racocetra fulgida]